jgi:hypothetical protein
MTKVKGSGMKMKPMLIGDPALWGSFFRIIGLFYMV